MAKNQQEIILHRGEVYLVCFDPSIGSEIQKMRPAVIVQNDIANKYSDVTIVAAITSDVGNKLYPTEVTLDAPEGGVAKKSIILLNQLRTIDKSRLLKRIGKITKNTLQKTDRALEISLGLVDF